MNGEELRRERTVQEPSAYYSYTLDNPSNVKAIVTAGAGVGRIGL
jgi:pectate lyase